MRPGPWARTHDCVAENPRMRTQLTDEKRTGCSITSDRKQNAKASLSWRALTLREIQPYGNGANIETPPCLGGRRCRCRQENAARLHQGDRPLREPRRGDWHFAEKPAADVRTARQSTGAQFVRGDRSVAKTGRHKTAGNQSATSAALTERWIVWCAGVEALADAKRARQTIVPRQTLRGARLPSNRATPMPELANHFGAQSRYQDRRGKGNRELGRP